MFNDLEEYLTINEEVSNEIIETLDIIQNKIDCLSEMILSSNNDERKFIYNKYFKNALLN